MGVYVRAAAGLGAITAKDKHTFRVELEPMARGDIPLNVAESYLSDAKRERWVHPLAEARRAQNADLYSDLIKQMCEVEPLHVCGAAMAAAKARVPKMVGVRPDAKACLYAANTAFRRNLGLRNLKPAKRPVA
jgi:hypothetical protein